MHPVEGVRRRCIFRGIHVVAMHDERTDMVHLQVEVTLIFRFDHHFPCL